MNKIGSTIFVIIICFIIIYSMLHRFNMVSPKDTKCISLVIYVIDTLGNSDTIYLKKVYK